MLTPVLTGCAVLAQGAARDPDALWAVVHDVCVPDLSKSLPIRRLVRRSTLPPAMRSSRTRPLCPNAVPLVLTTRVTGIEDRLVLSPEAPNYWALAWRARRYVDQRAARTLGRDDLSLAVNSVDGLIAGPAAHSYRLHQARSEGGIACPCERHWPELVAIPRSIGWRTVSRQTGGGIRPRRGQPVSAAGGAAASPRGDRWVQSGCHQRNRRGWRGGVHCADGQERAWFRQQVGRGAAGSSLRTGPVVRTARCNATASVTSFGSGQLMDINRTHAGSGSDQAGGT